MTAYLGFAVNNDEYKVMGLSAFGKMSPAYLKVKQLLQLNPDGSFYLNMKYFSYEYQEKMFNRKLSNLLGAPSRQPDAQMEKGYEDIAFATQLVFEEALFHTLNHLYKKHPSPNLILSGGSALNSLANGKICRNTPFKKFYITPDPGDGGGSLGAALYSHFSQVTPSTNHTTLPSAYLGPEFSHSQINYCLNKFGLEYTLIPDTQKLIDLVSDLLVGQKVIGWFQGRMEWGPRALGNRSILAAATDRKMMDTINAKVKHREMFRPFAPVILRERVKEYFITDKHISTSADYMLLVYPFKRAVRNNVPAVVHVDGSGRLQTIDRQSNQRYYDLINAYYQKLVYPSSSIPRSTSKGSPLSALQRML